MKKSLIVIFSLVVLVFANWALACPGVKNCPYHKGASEKQETHGSCSHAKGKKGKKGEKYSCSHKKHGKHKTHKKSEKSSDSKKAKT